MRLSLPAHHAPAAVARSPAGPTHPWSPPLHVRKRRGSEPVHPPSIPLLVPAATNGLPSASPSTDAPLAAMADPDLETLVADGQSVLAGLGKVRTAARRVPVQARTLNLSEPGQLNLSIPLFSTDPHHARRPRRRPGRLPGRGERGKREESRVWGVAGATSLSLSQHTTQRPDPLRQKGLHRPRCLATPCRPPRGLPFPRRCLGRPAPADGWLGHF